MSTFPHFATDAIHVGQEPEQWKSMAVVPPISMASTFKQSGPAEHSHNIGYSWQPVLMLEEEPVQLPERTTDRQEATGKLSHITTFAESETRTHTDRDLSNLKGHQEQGFEYSRSGNPTRNCLEKCIAALEDGKHGLVFSSGLAAMQTITFLLQHGDHIVSMNDVYGGSNRFFRHCATRMGIETTLVDCRDLALIKNALKPNTKMIWVETPTNPTMMLVDIEEVAKLIHMEAPQAFVVVDNTFMSPYFQRPLSLGADMVVHSLTKYMNGHSDVVMGAVVVNDDKYAERLRFFQNACGPVPSPFDCFLVNRGLKTLHLRMKEHMKNGLAVAKFLEGNPRVEKVIHPGLKSHPQHELAMKQMKGFSGMVTFYLKGGLEESRAFLTNLKVFTLAESLGGYESLVELPSLMTHASVPPKERDQLQISDSLVRLSVGIEDEEDLIEDLDQALKAAVQL